jgi:hypothetical protein
MRTSWVIAFLLGSAATTWSQTVYYATFTGENYAKETWHSSSLAAFKAAPPADVYDSYVVERHPNGSTSVHRDYTTPSGDWRFEFTYDYGRDAHLREIRSVFVAFGGITISGKDEGLTRCVRTFSVLPSGTLRKTSERITDEKSGRVVARQFYQPQVEHWMSLSQLPIPPKT